MEPAPMPLAITETFTPRKRPVYTGMPRTLLSSSASFR